MIKVPYTLVYCLTKVNHLLRWRKHLHLRGFSLCDNVPENSIIQRSWLRHQRIRPPFKAFPRLSVKLPWIELRKKFVCVAKHCYKQAEKRRCTFYHLPIKPNMQSGLGVVRGCCKMESSSSLFHLNNLMCCIWHGQLFGASMGGAEVDVCPHIPLGSWLATFSLLLGCHSRVSLTKNIWLPKPTAESNSSFLLLDIHKKHEQITLQHSWQKMLASWLTANFS